MSKPTQITHKSPQRSTSEELRTKSHRLTRRPNANKATMQEINVPSRSQRSGIRIWHVRPELGDSLVWMLARLQHCHDTLFECQSVCVCVCILITITMTNGEAQQTQQPLVLFGASLRNHLIKFKLSQLKAVGKQCWEPNTFRHVWVCGWG